MLHDQVVLLTGAGGGFGTILTRLLVAEGCRLILADRSASAARSAAEQAARAVPQAPGRVIGFCVADLSQPEGSAQLWAAASAISPQIDMLINNAGIAMLGRIDTIPQAQWEALMQVNLLAAMRLSALALPQMIARRSGHIVNISSAAGLVGAPGMSVYNASKFGLRGFSEALEKDVRRHGIRVTTIYPFFARTAILESPQYGAGRPRKLPDWLIEDPEGVMYELLRGIKQRRRHIYPGRIAQLIKWLRNIGP